MDILTVENVTAGYGKEPIIHDVTFGIPKGGIFGIIGPNGAGKTTLFKTISKVLKPWKGVIRYVGNDIAKISHKAYAAKVAVIPQFRTAPPPFTVEEFVSMGRYPHGGRLTRFTPEDRRIVEENIRRLKLEHFRSKRMDNLSGGEMQRVFLAQGLAQSPELILMDEPTSHLDITHKIRILDVISRLSRETGLTALIVLHDLNLASAYCDFLVMMKHGRIHARGSANDVLTEERILEVYETPVRIGEDPAIKKPHIFFLPQSSQK
ncbi:MAG TPA: ABC transporter ATP-binding protein [Deltaproteobacteria bacterium]|jgi:iron complex transport system ATP-binding protein|nr:ABC transporter ATP-binding protein [Deltaproteobacteria bacterium]